jgi:hypothetical protein
MIENRMQVIIRRGGYMSIRGEWVGLRRDGWERGHVKFRWGYEGAAYFVNE